MCSEADTHVCGVNSVGLKRAGFEQQAILNIKRAFKLLFFSGLSRSNALERIEQEFSKDEHVEYLVNFVKSSERGIMGGKMPVNGDAECRITTETQTTPR
jgi:acyl-[acyl carrier protein]--UDP-N-acetylglucosamine O-acyltransferase